jgi:diguanylate cyclase (GGDEF)-like protein
LKTLRKSCGKGNILDDHNGANRKILEAFGDIAISAVANILKSACGPADFIMRYGGDEFLVIASGRRKTLPEKVESLNKQYNDTSGMPFQLSLSIGSIFVKEQGGLPLDEYVKQADEAMYMAKKSGKHTYRSCGG